MSATISDFFENNPAIPAISDLVFGLSPEMGHIDSTDFTGPQRVMLTSLVGGLAYC